MNLKLLLQRGILYGFIGGGGTAILVVLIATVLNLSLGLTATVLFFGAIFALVLLLGAPGIGPGPAVDEIHGQSGFEGYLSSSTEGGGASRNPAAMVSMPSTQVEYVLYFLGLGIAATVLLAVLLS